MRAARVAAATAGRALEKPQVAFLVLGFVFGMLVLAINPPFRVPDTILHFYKAYGISDGTVAPEMLPPVDGRKRSGSYGARSFDTMEKEVGLTWPSGPHHVGDISRALDIPLNPGRVKFYDYSHNGRITASPLPYFPEALIIKVGRLFSLSPLWLVYLSGFFNLLLFLALGYLAIRLTPVLKWTFALLAFMPSAMSLAASVSEYAFDIAFSFLGIAYFFRLAFDDRKREVGRRDIAILFALAFLLALIKQPFFLIVLLSLMIPARKFSSLKQYLGLFAGLLIIALLVTLGWGLLANRAYRAPEHVDPEKRLETLKERPLEAAGDMLGSLKDSGYVLPQTAVASLGNVGQVTFPAWFIWVYVAALFLVTLLDGGEAGVLPAQKAVALVTILPILVAVFVLMYIYATVDTRHATDWLSGRYVIGVTPIFFLLFYTRLARLGKSAFFCLAVYAFVIFTIAYTCAELMNAYH